VNSGLPINTIAGNFFPALVFAPNNEYLAAGDRDGQISIWQNMKKEDK
jgi:hypothetical protein